MTDNINVCVRIRPLNEREKKMCDAVPWVWEQNSIAQTLPNGATSKATTFTFDHVFAPDTPTNELYEYVAAPIIQSAVEGVNATIFAYGQTSSGKTHTMQGTDNSPGVLPLAVEQIFQQIEETSDRDFVVRVSYLEIYNEVISDLVADKQKTLRIHEDAVRGVFVGGLTEEVCTTAEQVLEFMRKGQERRHVSSTRMNDQSSRSHTLFRVMIESRARATSAGGVVGAGSDASGVGSGAAGARKTRGARSTRSKLSAPRSSSSTRGTSGSVIGEQPGDVVRISQLNLVDLAGSERVRDTGSEGKQLREGGHINKSLLTLGTVIGKLADQADSSSAAAHIPYRDSKLTRILQTCLGGNARTAVVCTVTPARCHVDESLSTLKFANRAKRIRNQPQVNEVLDDKANLRRCRLEIDALRRRLADGNVESFERRIDELQTQADEAAEAHSATLERMNVEHGEQLDEVRAELRAAQRDERAATKQLATTQRDLERLRERFSKLEKSLAGATDDAAAAAERASSAECEARHMSERVQQLEQELREASNAVASDEVLAQLDEVRAELKQCQSERDAHRVAAREAADNTLDAEARAEAFQASLVQTHEQVAQIEAERDTAQAERDEARTQLAATRDTLAQRSIERDTLQQQFDECSAKLADTSEKLSTTRAELKQRSAELKSERGTTKQLRADLETMRAAAQRDTADAASARELLEAELEVQREYATAYEKQLEISAAQATALDELRASNAEQAARVDQLTSELRTAEQALDAAATRERGLKAKLREAGDKAARQVTKAGDAEAARAALATELAETRRQVAELQEQLDTTAAQLDEQTTRARAAEADAATAAEAQADGAVRLQLAAKHESTASRLRERCNKLADELDTAHEQLDSTEQRLQQIEAEHNSTVQQLQMRVETLNQSVTLLEEQLNQKSKLLANVQAGNGGGGGAVSDSNTELVETRVLVAQLQKQIADLKANQSSDARHEAKLAQLETALKAERERRLKVQAKLKQVVERVSASAGTTGKAAKQPLATRTNIRN